MWAYFFKRDNAVAYVFAYVDFLCPFCTRDDFFKWNQFSIDVLLGETFRGLVQSKWGAQTGLSSAGCNQP